MSKREIAVINAATDGACSGNPGPGGWAALIRFSDGREQELGGFEENTTNNRMELKAALYLFKELCGLPLHENLTIKTDSKYLINGLNKWILNWKKKGWKTASGKPVLNKDLWIELDEINKPSFKLEYVKAHSGDIDNERVDTIAVAFSKQRAITLKSSKAIKNSSEDINQTKSKRDFLLEMAEPKYQKLLSRLEIINQFYKQEYKIKSSEISSLLDINIDEIPKDQTRWKWREWLFIPVENQLWEIKQSKKEIEKDKANE